MVRSACLGLPRIGANRELKKSLEAFWKGKESINDLESTAFAIRKENLTKQDSLTYQSCCDFSFYDNVLDFSMEFNVIPERYLGLGLSANDLYFAIARGYQKNGKDVVASDMTKWFDTNYHYIVPEFSKNTKFSYSSFKVLKYFKEALSVGVKNPRPVVLGPITYVMLGKSIDGVDKVKLIESLAIEYKKLFSDLQNAGCKNIQIDEPYLACDLDGVYKNLYSKVYGEFVSEFEGIGFHIATYFESISENFDSIKNIPFASVHIDLTRGYECFDYVLKNINKLSSLSLGLVDGRSVWINDVSSSVELAKKAVQAIGASRVIVATSSSLLHCPVSLQFETRLDSEIKSWMAFANEKVVELSVIANVLNGVSLASEVAKNSSLIKSKQTSVKIHNNKVLERLKMLDGNYERSSEFSARYKKQEYLGLPLFPTTTIGSFPQTEDIRRARKLFKDGKISEAEYNESMKKEIAFCIQKQEQIGIDVLVHGEAERNDMVEYFGEQLNGFVFTENGWVQSYGSRCVKPPVIYGDVSRKSAMTVEWSKYAQSLTKYPVKGMLTGPITILQWSFVRNDLSRESVCKQIALALQDEVLDLESAGINIIQIDEPAIREGLPIKKAKWSSYLKWAVDSFKISAFKVKDETQIHTHMCYSEFNDIIKAVADLDADVISIETSRSHMGLLDAFKNFNYPNAIGPGVYDIHSPRVPSKDEILALIKKAQNYIPNDRVWVNPDCGLKTRSWPETIDALKNMVDVAKSLR